MTYAEIRPIDIDFNEGVIKFQGFDREAKATVTMYTIEVAGTIFWFDILQNMSTNGIDHSVQVKTFGWLEQFKLVSRPSFTEKSANAAQQAIAKFFSGSTLKLLGVDRPRGNYITSLFFSSNWILIK